MECIWVKQISKTTPESSQKESVPVVKCHWDTIEQGGTMCFKKSPEKNKSQKANVCIEKNVRLVSQLLEKTNLISV